MIRAFFDRRRQSFVDWWHAPITRNDRKLGALVGGLGCFWIGVLGRFMFGPMPVSLTTVGWWALGSVVVGVTLGIIFPKVTSCVCFPFSTFGGGSGT